MKKSSLRNLIISLSSAVTLGVVFLTVGSAVSNTPTINPPGEGVSPTFTGIDVRGDAKISGSLHNGTQDAGTNATPLSVNDDLLVSGRISNGNDNLRLGNGIGMGSVVIDSALTVVGRIANANGRHLIFGNGTEASGIVKIDDDLEVTGESAFQQDVTIGLAEAVGGYANLDLNGNALIRGNVTVGHESPEGTMNILRVNGRSHLFGDVYVGFKSIANNNLTVTGHISANSIGTYTQRNTGLIRVNTSHSLSCATGEIAISCGYSLDETLNAKITKMIPINETDGNGSCDFSVDAPASFIGYALCFDPKL